MTSFQTNKKLRLERETIFQEIGGIHTFKYSAYQEEESVLCGNTTHTIIDDMAGMIVRSDLDFEMAEYYYNKYRRNNDGN